VRRVGELGIHRTALALERRHAAASLVWLVPEGRCCGRVAHLLLVLGVVAAPTSALSWVAAATWSAGSLSVALSTEVALAGLRGVASHMSLWVAGC
jgi:hypothetical protein